VIHILKYTALSYVNYQNLTILLLCLIRGKVTSLPLDKSPTIPNTKSRCRIPVFRYFSCIYLVRIQTFQYTWMHLGQFTSDLHRTSLFLTLDKQHPEPHSTIHIASIDMSHATIQKLTAPQMKFHLVGDSLCWPACFDHYHRFEHMFNNIMLTE
jgi:hypothetical protein